VGPRCAKLQVKDPQRFAFDRSKLMGSMAQLMAKLGQRQEFVAAVRWGGAWGLQGGGRGREHRAGCRFETVQ